jgi:hypothetical protein
VSKAKPFLPGEKVRVLANGLRTNRIVEISEILVHWIGVRYRTTDGEIYLEWNLEGCR